MVVEYVVEGLHYPIAVQVLTGKSSRKYYWPSISSVLRLHSLLRHNPEAFYSRMTARPGGYIWQEAKARFEGRILGLSNTNKVSPC